MDVQQPLALALLASLGDITPILATIALFQGLALGVWRVPNGWPLVWLVLPGYGVIALFAALADAPSVAGALDLGTAATFLLVQGIMCST
jgi:hypothetical protein